MNKTLLLVTHDASARALVTNALSHRGYRVLAVEEAAHAIEQIQQAPIDLVITEIGPQGISSLDCLDQVVKELLRMSAVVIAGEETPVRVLSEVIRQNASQLLIKPFQEWELLRCIERTLREQPPPMAPPPLRRGPAISNIITQNSAFGALLEEATKVARTDTTVLITGETGTGKELLAQEIHRISRRADRAFVVVNCAALSETLLETELFGHARGAFTGADHAKSGFFEIANGGTIFLDEIGEISQSFQLKLLRILQQGEYNRVGDTRTYRTDVRVLAATNRDLTRAVAQQQFRADLFYRLNVVHLVLPPLRERRDDIPLLAHFFLTTSSASLSKPVTRISSGALSLLEQHDWPGNVRELQNVIERAVIMCEGNQLAAEDLPAYLRQAPHTQAHDSDSQPRFDIPFKRAKAQFVGEFERRYILHHLSLNRGNVAKTARTTGMFEGHLYQKIKRYHINPNQFRPGS